MTVDVRSAATPARVGWLERLRAPSFAEARFSRASRASAAAWRMPAGPFCVPVDWLPAVVPWSGVYHVSD